MSNFVSKKGKAIRYIRVAELGDSPLDAVYLESFESEGKYGTTLNHKFKALADTDLTVTTSRTGKKSQGGSISEGEIVVINGVGALNKQIENTVMGETVRVLFKGQKTMKGGDFDGSLAYDVEVLSDEDAPILDKSELLDYLYEGTEGAAS